MKRLRVFLAVLVLAVPALLAAALAALDTPAADAYLGRALPRWAARGGLRLSAGDVDLQPWSARLVLDRVAVASAEQGGWELRTRRLEVGLRVWESLLGTPHLELSLEAPQLRGELPAGGEGAGEGSGGGAPPRVVLHTLLVSGGSVDLRDPGRELSVAVAGLEVAWRDGAGGGSATGVRVGWRGAEETLERVAFAGARRFATLEVERLEVTGPRLQLQARGRVGPWRLLALELEGAATLDGLPAPWLEAAHLTRFAPVGGTLRVAGQLSGSTRSPAFEGTAEVAEGRFGTVRDATLAAALEADRGGLRFRRLEGASNVARLRGVSGEFRWDDGVRLRARGQVERYRLRPFMGILFPTHWFPVGLTATGEFEAEGPLAPELALEARVALEVRDLDVTTGEGPGERRTRFALPWARVRSRCTVGRQELRFGPSRVETESVDVDIAGGRIAYREGLWFDTDAQVRSLALARPLLPEWIDARGRAEGRFGGPYRELVFAYDVDLDAVRLGGRELGRLRGQGRFDLKDLEVAGGRLSGPLGELAFDGGVTLRPGGEHRWDLRWEQGDLAEAADLVRAVGGRLPAVLAGSVAAKGRLAGPLAAPRFAGDVRTRDLQVDRFRVDAATASGSAGRGGWRVERADLDAYGARAEGRGRGDAQGFDARLQVSGLAVGPFLDRIGVPLPVQGRFDGAVRAAGPYAAARVDVQGRVGDPAAWGVALPDADLELALDREALELAAASEEQGLAFQCRRAFADGVLEGLATARDTPWGALPPTLADAGLAGEAVTGEARLRVTADGAVGADWEGSATGVRWRELEVGPVAFAGDLGAGAVSLRAAAWERRLRLEALLSPEPGAPVALDLTLEAFPVARLAPFLDLAEGTADGHGTALLGLEQWRAADGLGKLAALAELELALDLRQLRDADGLALPDLAARVTSPDGRPRLEASGEGLHLQGTVEDLGAARWRLDAALDGFAPWSLLPPQWGAGEVTGRVTGSGWVRGQGAVATAGEAGGTLEAAAWRGWGRSNWQWRARLSGGAATATLEEPRGVVVGARWDPAAGLDATLGLREVPLGGWVPPESPATALEGLVEGTGSLHWAPGAAPRAEVELTELALRWPPLDLVSRGPVVLRWDGDAVTLAALSLAGDGLRAEAAGSVRPGREWDLSAEATLDLGSLAGWLPQVERASGRAELGLTVRGPWHAPEVRAPVEVPVGASAKLAGVPVALEDLDASGALEGPGRFTLEWLDAQVRDGRLHLEGSLDLDAWRPGELRFYSEVRDLDLQWPAQVAYRFDADALVTGTAAAPQVRGEVRLEQFRYSRPVSLRQLVLDALKRAPRRVEQTAREGVFVDLAVRGADDVRVENNVADLDLNVDLRARGYLPEPALWGRVDVVGGTVRFSGREYRAHESTVEFLGETQPVPQLDLHAQTLTRDYQVNVDVTGPLDDYQVELSSVPPLTRTDIVALLTLGMTAEELQTAQSTGGAQGASLLSEGFREELGAVGGVLGIDTFRIDSAYSPATQTTVPRITVGKTVTEKLRAWYSAAMGADTQQDVEVEYTLNPRISLLGTWVDRETRQRGSLGGEVRFRFPFR